ncbi:hypothetical protein [Streptomyces sp. NPDC006140]|uniref:hypothetical protein n=1 Tax=Streptomyces sp. NPDC006140 TaxID=3154579 RepID=UPI0033D6B392
MVIAGSRLQADRHAAVDQAPDDQQDGAADRRPAQQQEERHRSPEGHGDDQHAPVHPARQRRASDEVADHACHAEPEQQRADESFVDARQLLKCRTREGAGRKMAERDEGRRDDADARARVAELLSGY